MNDSKQDGANDGGSKKPREALRLANLSSIGIALVLCTFIGYGIGAFIDKHAHTAPVFTLVFLLVGIAAGFVNVFRTISANVK